MKTAYNETQVSSQLRFLYYRLGTSRQLTEGIGRARAFSQKSSAGGFVKQPQSLESLICGLYMHIYLYIRNVLPYQDSSRPINNLSISLIYSIPSITCLLRVQNALRRIQCINSNETADFSPHLHSNQHIPSLYTPSHQHATAIINTSGPGQRWPSSVLAC